MLDVATPTLHYCVCTEEAVRPVSLHAPNTTATMAGTETWNQKVSFPEVLQLSYKFSIFICRFCLTDDCVPAKKCSQVYLWLINPLKELNSQLQVDWFKPRFGKETCICWRTPRLSDALIQSSRFLPKPRWFLLLVCIVAVFIDIGRFHK